MVDISRLTQPIANSEIQDPADFERSANRLFPEIDQIGQQMNAVRDEMVDALANVNANVESLANLVWVSGTTYTAGQVRWSPVDFGSYRRKTNGGGTIDPSNDPTNWAATNKSSSGGAELPVSATDITLTSLSSRFQAVTMTAAGMRVNLPSATSLEKGVALYVIKNIGTYRFHVAKSDTSFVCFVEPGQTVQLNLTSSDTAAGKWHVFGQNLQNIYDLNASTQLLSGASGSFDVVKLSSTKFLFVYKKDSNSKLYARTINYGGALGTETQIGTDSILSESISVDALSETKAVIAYKPVAATVRVVVVDIATDVVTAGGSIDVDAAVTNTYHQLKVIALTSIKAMCFYISGSTSQLYARPINIAGSTPSGGTLISTALNTMRFTACKLTSSKMLVTYAYGQNSTVNLHLMSDTATTGTPVVAYNDFVSASSVRFDYCPLNQDSGILSLISSYKDHNERIIFNVINTYGLTPVITKPVKFGVNDASGSVYPSLTLVDANTIYMSWYSSIAGGLNGVTMNLTADEKLRFGVVSENIEPSINALTDSIKNITIDATTVLQFARKSTPELVYKTIRIYDITDSNQIATASASTIVLGGGGGGGGGGSGAPGADGNSAFIRYASDANGTGFTDIAGTNAYVGIVSLPPDSTPTVADFAGKWHKWNGPSGNGLIYGVVDPTPAIGEVGQSYVNTETSKVWWNKSTDPVDPWGVGFSLKGDQGFVGGFIYQVWSGASEADPGTGWVAFNSATYSVNTLTHMYINSTTARGQNILDIIATMDVDDLLFFQSATIGNEVLYLAVTTVTPQLGGTWYTIGITYKGGNSLTNNKEYSIGYTKSIGMQQLLNNNVVRYDPATLNLLDKNGDVISITGGGGSSSMSGTFAQMRALPIGSWAKKQYMVTDYGARGGGLLFRSNGTEAVVDGDGQLYSDHPVLKVIFPNSQPTAISNNGGKVQLTSAAHTLTTALSVDAVDPCSIRANAWTGSGAAVGFYKILSVDDADKYTIDLNYNSAYGVPTVAQKNVPVTTGISIPIPPLNNYSEIIISILAEYTSGPAIKQIIADLNGSVFAISYQNSENQVTGLKRFGFRNAGAKNKQESLFLDSFDSVQSQSSSVVRKLAVSTTAATTVTIKVMSSSSNEYVGIRHVEAIIRN